MTREEAIAYTISTGNPIRHKFFEKDEYVRFDGAEKCLIDESGIMLPYDEFWSIRSGGYWEDGWSWYIITKQ